VKDDVVPLIIKEFGIDIKDIFFLDGSGLKVLYAPLPLLFYSWGGGVCFPLFFDAEIPSLALLD
jgi:hypothetical protein